MISTAPSAQTIARTIVVAAQMTGEDPEAIIGTRQHFRGRLIAYAALLIVFPGHSPGATAALLNFAETRNAQSRLAAARRSAWWNEDRVDELVGELVADQYGEQAA
ncbi:hypothetical protein GCM10007913_11470 [Devosia yakushimensis]|uniref:Uncharacterized protein n=1 Tax=Devosia yakushimensis TaxID=470028 RepID=A0ABQ5UBT9_9HYPH|nr:hypothetical protein [Devosia yakushimensis]GLQ09215.1 hypothetical protein GCM10007913_11470 [Devosia yakushimensis]